ncbi:MAG: hypothetical protein KDD60_07350 [Bdellovibrionales bacterium]|nr:hypothetical protein [Bdellovibrionales bacterium]
MGIHYSADKSGGGAEPASPNNLDHGNPERFFHTNFDPGAYDYADHTKEFRALENILSLSPGSLEQIRQERGGKGVSLAISNAIELLDPRLKVPDQILELPKDVNAVWELFQKMSQDDEQLIGFIFRTSDPNEDWIDSRCGVGYSWRVDMKLYGLHGAKSAIQKAEELEQAGEQFIVQPFYRGIGYVADVAYSRLLGKPVVHVASGRRYRDELIPFSEEQLTSPTEDFACSHNLFDLVSGEQITPKVSQQNPKYADSYNASDFQREIFTFMRQVAEVGFPFGFQIELKVHPDAPDVWRLLQFRPSPDRLRPSEEFVLPKEEPLLISGYTSGHGHARGNVIKPEPNISGPPTETEEACINALQASREAIISDDFTGKVVLWKNLNGYYQDRLKILLGASLRGAVAQISEGPTFTAVNHDGFQGYANYQREYLENAIARCLFIGLTNFEQQTLYGERSWSPYYSPSEVEIFSDGLVALLYKRDLPTT